MQQAPNRESQWRTQRTRTGRAAVALAMALSMVTFGTLTVSSPAQAAIDPDTQDLADAIEELGAVLGMVSTLEELAEAIPLTDVAPGAAHGLDLLSSLDAATTALDAALGASMLPPGDLEIVDVIEDADTSVGDVDISFGCLEVDGDTCADPVGLVDDAGVIDYHIPITVTTTVDPTLLFESDVFDMDGQTFPIDLSLSTALDLRFDTNLVPTDDRFSLVTAPSISITVEENASVPNPIVAESRIGVADVSVSLTGFDLGVGFAVTMVDPDGLDGLTRDEWMSTAIADLVAETDGVVRTGSISGTLIFDTDLIAGVTDGSVSIADDLGDGFDFMLSQSDLGDLANFTLITPAAIIAGIGQAAAGIGGAQAIGDVPLPFLDGSLRRVVQASRPILDAIDALGVICGTEGAGDTVPAGSVEDLTAGTTVYCRAIVSSGVAADSVSTPIEWGSTNAIEGVNTTDDDVDDTIGVTPTKNAVFTMDGDGDFDVSVSYTATFDDDNDGEVDTTEARTSTQAPLSVSGLAAELDALAGFDATPETLFDYDETQDALRIDLAKTFDPGAVQIPLNIGNQLEAGTGLAGLQTRSGSIEANAGQVKVDLTAGVLLLPESDWGQVTVDGGCPDPSVTDPADLCQDALNLFFVEVDPTTPEFVVEDASFGLAGPNSLAGSLGYLEIDASVPEFQLGRADDNLPVFAIELTPGGALAVDDDVIPNAISLRELLFDIVPRTQVSDLNLSLTGVIAASAQLDGTPIATAMASFDWNLLAGGLPSVDATGQQNFADAFANFNPLPNLFGTHSGPVDGTTLVAAVPSFGDAVVGARVQNVTDGSSCEVGSIAEPAPSASLVCSSPLAGGDSNMWESGDLYRVEIGGPLAMLEALLDNLDSVLGAIENIDGGVGEALDTELPVVGVSPRTLLGQVDDIRRALGEIREPVADVICGLEPGGGLPTGDPSELVLVDPDPDDGPPDIGVATIYCSASHNKPASDVEWTATGIPGVSATPSIPGDGTGTIGAPASEVVTITFEGAAGTVVPEFRLGLDEDGLERKGYQVAVEFTDNDGPHTSEYPTLAQPTSIQKLEQVVRQKLGLTDGFGLETGTVDGNDVVILDLEVARCNDGELCAAPDTLEPITSEFNADVPGFGGLVAASAAGELTVGYDANARLRLAFALDGGTAAWVMPETGIGLEARFVADDLSFDATLGPLTVKAGTGVINDGTPGLGVVELGAGLDIGFGGSTTPVPVGAFVDNPSTFVSAEFSGDENADCGTIVMEVVDPADPSLDVTEELSGVGCAAISIGIGEQYVADLGLEITLTGDQFVITPRIPVDLEDRLLTAALDYGLLLKALPEILGSVESGLSATAASAAGNGKIPLVGDALDAGAEVAGALSEVSAKIIDRIPQSVFDATDTDGLTTALQDYIYGELGPDGDGLDVLVEPDGGAAADDPTDVDVVLDCGGGPNSCAPATDVANLQDVRVIFSVGQAPEIEALPFDLGMDGVPLRLAGSLAPEVGWHFVVDLGLSRATGPYVGVNNPDGSDRDELVLHAEIGLDDAPSECPNLPDPALGIGGGFSATECLGGQIAFLGINVANAVGPDATAATLDVTLDLANEGVDTLGFNNASDISLEPNIGLAANVDLFFQTGIVGGQDAGFPSVVGTFSLDWDWALNQTAEPSEIIVEFDDLYLDVSPLVDNLLEPIFSEIRRYTGPFQPIIETLTAPIPVVSDLAALVGEPPVTLLGLMEVISGNDLSLIQSIAAFISFINSPLTGSGYFALGSSDGGSFSIDPEGSREAQSPTSAQDLVNITDVAASSLLAQEPVAGSSDINDRFNDTPPTTKANLPGTFGVPGLTFPFLDNPGQIFGLLLGQDITLVRYDFGPLEASAGFSYNFPPIMVGPVPIGIGVGGSVTVRGRFAVGYDTSGLRKVLAGGSGTHLFDGIFLDDLDANGVDVPEISFIGEVYAQAGVTIGIASAGIVAGLRITVDLNLDDSPEPDGKLRIEEIFNKLQNPICLFDIAGKLEAFIKAFVELDLFLVELRFDFTILEIELLNFSGKCEPPKPVLAEVTPGGTLILNVGERRTIRNIAENEEDEEFTVRPINGAGGFSVSAFGVYQTYGIGGEFDSGIEIIAISADAAAGDDTLQMLSGGDQAKAPKNPDDNTGEPPENTEIPFYIAVNLDGGADNDILLGGIADDTLTGGPGDDRLEGGPGVDTIDGNDGNDTINGDEGDDTMNGGADEDIIQGGPGNDTADGGPGADLVQGGPGTATEGGTDGNDTLAGGTGPDTVEGGTGDDHLFGDEQVANYTDPAVCVADSADHGDPSDDGDKVSGGDGDDEVYGGHGDDELFGGSGNDLVCGNQGADLIDGDLGSATTETDENDDEQVDTSGGDDRAHGGSGNDTVAGNWGHDYVLGDPGADIVEGDEGNDDVAGGTGGDLLRGGVGVDLIVGDTATISQANDKSARTTSSALDEAGLVSGIATGTGGTPNCSGLGSPANQADCIRGGPDDDVIWGEAGRDDINGDDGDDIIRGNDGDDNAVRGGKGDDLMFGNDGVDIMFGDNGDDRMFGNADNDQMRGLADDDYMEGNGGSDVMLGDGGQDDMIGGTSGSTAPDMGDFMFGGALADVMVGDNGEIVRPSGDGAEGDDPTVIVRNVTIHDVGENTVGGNDQMWGLDANDRMFGGNQDDTMFGGDGRDLMEGNDGNDTINGDDGPDRIVGGSSSRATLRNAALAIVAYDDARDNTSNADPTIDPSGDTLRGNDGDDVIAGDNALADIDGSVQMTAENANHVFGADEIHGNVGRDRLYGQLGGDEMYGNQDEDYLLGDLGFVAAMPTKTWPEGAPDYDVDLDAPGPDVIGIDDPALGADYMEGNDANDHMFGGAGDDEMRGNDDDDYMEGNGGEDTMYGNLPGVDAAPNDEDDMIGGSSSWTRSDDIRLDQGETIMQGNGDHDVMTGDNAHIARIVDSNDPTQWAADEVTPGRKRIVTLLDREKLGAPLESVSGADHMQGNGGDDRMFGEGGADLVQGNDDEDLIQGNQDADWLEGNDGEDDLIGGSSYFASVGGAPLGGSGADLGDPDAGDAIFGGADADVITGDNAIVIRRTPDNEAAYQTALAGTGTSAPYYTSDHLDAVPGWWLGPDTDRLVLLLDRTGIHSGRFGNDIVSAGSGEDAVFAQDGADWATGGGGDDGVEGNGGSDIVYGDRSPETAGDAPTYLFGERDWEALGLVSAVLERDGAPEPDGEDDLVGGSNVVHRDGDDRAEGDAEDDFILGDNGTLQRQIVGAEYVDHQGDGAAHDRIFRRAERLGVADADTGVFGDDELFGNDGDDAIWGQDGDDDVRGQNGDDDLLGELGDDIVYGGNGEDAMIGDRGSILNTELGVGDALFVEASTTESYNGPPFLTSVEYFTTGRFDRRVDLLVERPGSVGGPFPGTADVALAADGRTAGGNDTMRGGPGHDSMHGAFGDDIMNGDDGGDWLFGDDGSDVMWGGRGNPDGSPDLGTDFGLVDRLFGGHGGDPATGQGIVTGGSDILDYKPRVAGEGPYADPVEWFEATQPYDDGTGAGGAATTQHHHGTDWIYGGWDRDVMEGNVTTQGPNDGDRLWDWTGTFNLWTHCAPDYGGWNDIRARSPQMEAFLQLLAYDSGVGGSLDQVLDPASSAYRELALVYKPDTKFNNGKPYPTTPGHFDEPAACDDN